MTHPVSIETSTGDGLLMAMRAGAMLSNMREAWWIPVGEVPVSANPIGRILVNGQRTLPHSIMVNRRGRRFTNEAANYNAFGAAFHVEDVSRFEYANLPCWLIFDQNYVDTYGFRIGAGSHGSGVPDWIVRADSPGELGATLGIDGDELEATVATVEHDSAPMVMTRTSAAATAPSTAGGATPTARVAATPHSARSTGARTTRSRSTAVRWAPRAARASTPTPGSSTSSGEPIPGLYAAGNVMGSPFGMTYGGPGGTIGPAMVFGYLAGRHAAARYAPLDFRTGVTR